MSARVVLSCDGQEGIFPCRQAIPVGEVLTGRQARQISAKDGWSKHAGDDGITDFCPSCTKKRSAKR